MAEGVAAAGALVSRGVHDDPEAPPPPGPDAPKGWTWNRKTGSWAAKIRGPVLWAPGQQEPPAQQEQPAQQPAADAQAPPDDDRDPDPAWMQQQDGRTEVVPIRTFQVDSETRADIRALIALGYTIPGETLPLLDPYCFGPLAEEETATGVIDAVTDIVCGSPRIAAWAASVSGLMPWIKLGKALQPVAVAAFRHHVIKSVDVQVDREKREMHITRRDWSQYTAA